VRFLGHLSTPRLVADRPARTISDEPLVPVAIALFLLALAEGLLIRLAAQLPGGPGWR
jgi:hypothetical protein